MDMGAPRETYKILDAPSGYTGQFSIGAGFPSDKWKVRYSGTAVYLEPVRATLIVFQ